VARGNTTRAARATAEIPLRIRGTAPLRASLGGRCVREADAAGYGLFFAIISNIRSSAARPASSAMARARESSSSERARISAA